MQRKQGVRKHPAHVSNPTLPLPCAWPWVSWPRPSAICFSGRQASIRYPSGDWSLASLWVTSRPSFSAHVLPASLSLAQYAACDPGQSTRPITSPWTWWLLLVGMRDKAPDSIPDVWLLTASPGPRLPYSPAPHSPSPMWSHVRVSPLYTAKPPPAFALTLFQTGPESFSLENPVAVGYVSNKLYFIFIGAQALFVPMLM